MANIDILNTLCPVCDEPIHFEAYRLGERVNCPHCQEMIALGSVEPLLENREATSKIARFGPPVRNGLMLLACAAVVIWLSAWGMHRYRKVAALPPQRASPATELAINVNATQPLQPPVASPVSSPPPLPPVPNADEVRAEQIRQAQAQLNQQQLLAELRRANNIAEANARWQRWHEIESQQAMASQPVEIIQPTEVIQPTEIIQPIPIFQVFPTFSPPVRYYGGGLRVGSPVFYNAHPPGGQRIRQDSPMSGVGQNPSLGSAGL